jgi:hypothetical protein
MREFDMECGCCIHYQEYKAKQDYCNKHRDKIPFTGFCDDFWPPNPTCAECRFATVSRDPAYAKQTGHVYCTFKDDHRYCDLFCPEWRCRVQS